MRVLVFTKVAEEDGKHAPPTTEAFEAMDRFTEELVKAGVLVAAAGLKSTAFAKRIANDGRGGAVVLDGPFAESKDVIAGFSIWEVKDMDEALSWAKHAPNSGPGQIELRPFLEAADLAEFLSPEDLAASRKGDRGRLGVA
jgi:hypothetical protein